MQFQADILDRPVATAAAPEVSALGAAALAFAGLGMAMPRVPGAGTCSPAMADADRAAPPRALAAAVAQTLAHNNNQTRGGTS